MICIFRQFSLFFSVLTNRVSLVIIMNMFNFNDFHLRNFLLFIFTVICRFCILKCIFSKEFFYVFFLLYNLHVRLYVAIIVYTHLYLIQLIFNLVSQIYFSNVFLDYNLNRISIHLTCTFTKYSVCLTL